MAHFLGRNEKRFADAYARDLFYAYCMHKTQVVLSLYEMVEISQLANSEQLGARFFAWFMNPIKEQTHSEVAHDASNCFKPVLFELFPKLQEIVVYTTDEDGDVVFAMNLVKLLEDVICAAVIPRSMRRIIIKDGDQQWLEKVVSNQTFEAFAARNLQITLTKNQGMDAAFEDREEDWLTVLF